MPSFTTGRGVRAAADTRAARKPERFMPRCFVVSIPVLLSLLIVLTLNVRAWTNARHESQINQQLNAEIEQLTTGNTSLQEEIHRLQYDPKTTEREARKLGMGRMNEKVFVPTQ